jgi:hypothetical protein
MELFKQRNNYYLIFVGVLLIKSFIFGFGMAEALLGLGLLSLEGFKMYLDSRQKSDPSEDLKTRISSLESKFGLTMTRK